MLVLPPDHTLCSSSTLAPNCYKMYHSCTLALVRSGAHNEREVLLKIEGMIAIAAV